jgi:hypothetical protein
MNNYVLCIAVVLCFGVLLTHSEVFIDYGADGEGVELFKYFRDFDDGFYVDLGAYDPIADSATLNLHVRGWSGVNVEANPQRLNRFFLERPFDVNVNYAVGDADTFVTLFEMSDDGLSTVSPKVRDFAKTASQKVERELSVPSLTLQQLCERYFLRKPTFMSVSVGGIGSAALETNNWSNELCVPKLIFSELSDAVRHSELPLPETVLTKHGYTKVAATNRREVFVHSSAAKELQQSFKSAEAAAKGLRVVSFQSVSAAVAKHFGVAVEVGKHYEPHSAKVVYEFAKAEEPIEL